MPRIVTLTLNPALDIASAADKVEPTHKIRTRGEHMDPGGGGINVARVLHALGGETEALLLAGGVTGNLVAELLAEAGVPHRVLPIAGRTRISLTVHDDSDGQEYRFVPEGPEVTESEWKAVLAALETIDAGWLVVSGSLPRGVPADFYARVGDLARRRGQRFVLDTSGAALEAAIGHGITLIKPSLRELETLVGRALPTVADREAAAQRLIADGAAAMIVVSLGREGAMLVESGGIAHRPALEGPVRSTVGAGDAFVAGMVLALSRGETAGDALGWGIASGAAAVSSIGTARVRAEDVRAFYRHLS